MAERRGFPAGPVLRRAAAQWPLLVAVLVVMVLCGALVGTGALLVGPGRHAALAAAATAADGTLDAGDRARRGGPARGPGDRASQHGRAVRG